MEKIKWTTKVKNEDVLKKLRRKKHLKENNKKNEVDMIYFKKKLSTKNFIEGGIKGNRKLGSSSC